MIVVNFVSLVGFRIKKVWLMDVGRLTLNVDCGPGLSATEKAWVPVSVTFCFLTVNPLCQLMLLPPWLLPQGTVLWDCEPKETIHGFCQVLGCSSETITHLHSGDFTH